MYVPVSYLPSGVMLSLKSNKVKLKSQDVHFKIGRIRLPTQKRCRSTLYVGILFFSKTTDYKPRHPGIFYCHYLRRQAHPFLRTSACWVLIPKGKYPLLSPAMSSATPLARCICCCCFTGETMITRLLNIFLRKGVTKTHFVTNIQQFRQLDKTCPA